MKILKIQVSHIFLLCTRHLRRPIFIRGAKTIAIAAAPDHIRASVSTGKDQAQQRRRRAQSSSDLFMGSFRIYVTRCRLPFQRGQLLLVGSAKTMEKFDSVFLACRTLHARENQALLSYGEARSTSRCLEIRRLEAAKSKDGTRNHKSARLVLHSLRTSRTASVNQIRTITREGNSSIGNQK